MAEIAKARRIEIRVTEEEHRLGKVVATALGVSLSEFYRRAARESAEEVLAERFASFSMTDAERFLDVLEHPEQFEAGMARLAGRSPVIPNS